MNPLATEISRLVGNTKDVTFRIGKAIDTATVQLHNGTQVKVSKWNYYPGTNYPVLLLIFKGSVIGLGLMGPYGESSIEMDGGTVDMGQYGTIAADFFQASTYSAPQFPMGADMNVNKITGVADPTSGMDATNKQYADFGTLATAVNVYPTAAKTLTTGVGTVLGPFSVRNNARFTVVSDGITIPYTGFYVATATADFVFNATGWREIDIWNATSSVTIAITRGPAVSVTDKTIVTCTAIFRATAADKIQAIAKHTAGANLDVAGTSSNYTSFTVAYLGVP